MLWKIHNWTELIQGQEMNLLDNYKMKLQETSKCNRVPVNTRDITPIIAKWTREWAIWAQELATWAQELATWVQEPALKKEK